jgi:putative addiction module component (TIGR02574 family)
MVGISVEEINKLSIDERLELLEQISVSLENEDPQPPLTEAQRTEVQRRLELDKRGELPSRPWAEVRRDLETRHR